MSINRWYTKDQITLVERNAFFRKLMREDEAFSADVQAADSTGSTFYQIIVNEKLQPDERATHLFSLSEFDNSEFIEDIKLSAVRLFLRNKGVALEADQASLIAPLKATTVVTRQFHIGTGSPSTGAMISFQVYINISSDMVNAIANKARPRAGASPDLDIFSSTFGETPPAAETDELEWTEMPEFVFNSAVSHLPSVPKLPQLGFSDLSYVYTALKSAKTKNDALEEKYNIDFDALAVDIRAFQTILEQSFYSNLERQLWNNWKEITQSTFLPAGIADHIGLNSDVPMEAAVSRSTSSPEDKIQNIRRATLRYKFVFSKEGDQPSGEKIQFASVVSYLAPRDAAQQQKEIEEGYIWEDNGLVVTSAESLNETLSSEAILLIYLSRAIAGLVRARGNAWDIQVFVENFFHPIPDKSPASGASTATDTVYKSEDDIRREVLTPEQKAAIHNHVLQSYNQVGDPNFLNMLQNATNISSIEDVYSYVLDVIPIKTLMQLTSRCMQKYIPDIDLKSRVCDTIISNLHIEEVDKLLSYMGTSTNTEVRSLYNDLIAEIPSPISEDKQGDTKFSGFAKDEARKIIREKFTNNLRDRDTICLAVFAAIPAALTLLSIMDPAAAEEFAADKFDAAYDAVSEAVESNIINPAKDIIDSLRSGLDIYQITSHTKDWSQKLTNHVWNFVDGIIAQSTQTIVEEISYLCEGSSKSDMSNLGSLIDWDGPVDVVPTFPFVPTMVRDVVSDPTVLDDLSDFAGPKVTLQLIRDFLDDLGKLLTISEICNLLDENGSPYVKKILYDKIWFGLLSMEKYLPLKEALGSIGSLKQFFFILGKKVSKKQCINRLKSLDNTKKILSDMCETSNGALIEDLKKKAADDAIAALLEQENSILDNLLDSMKDMIKPDVPPLFCGPDSDKSGLPPVFESHEHPSQKYLNDIMMRQMFKPITSMFEKNIGFYKSFLLLDGGAQFQTAAANVLGATAKIYAMTDGDDNTIAGNSKGDMDTLKNNGEFVAPLVYSALVNSENNILVEPMIIPGSDDLFMKIDTSNQFNGQDVATLKFNFSSSPVLTIPGKTSRLEFGPENAIRTFDLPIEEASVPTPQIVNEIVNSFDDNNNYDQLIKSRITEGDDFYSLLLDQVITEHAEYASRQGLFKREIFTKLNLNKKDVCDTSLLEYEKILDEIPANIKAMNCKVAIGSIPSAPEIAQINAILETLIKVVTVQEFLKSLMVFSAFGIKSLLPEKNKKDSFYFEYLVSQIDESLNNQSSQEIIQQYFRNYTKVVYASRQNKSPDEVSLEDIKREVIGKHIVEIQNKMYEKLNALDLLGGTSAIPGLSGEVGALEEEYTDTASFVQVLSNLVPTDEIFEPPSVEGVDIWQSEFTIPAGFYSDNERLMNGGFFIEEGFDVSPKRKDDLGAHNAITMLVAQAKLESQLTLIDFSSPVERFQKLMKQSPIGDYIFLLDMDGKAAFYHPENSLANLGTATEFGVGHINDYIQSYAQRIGKLPLSRKSNYTEAYENRKSIFSDYNLKFEEGSELDEILFGDAAYNRFFNRLSYYKSLNLLIPVSDNAVMNEKYDTLGIGGAGYNYDQKSGIAETIYNRKYFLREADGKRYFKLPILTFYGDKNATESEMFSHVPGLASFDKIIPDLQNANSKNMNAILLSMADDERFKEFAGSIQYKSLLSFLSIILAELMEQKYPKLKQMFNGTTSTLYSGLNTLHNNANRNTDPDYYQKSTVPPGSPSLEEMEQGMNQNWLPMIIKAFFGSMANMTDPTWKTPWFLPGPITPFGIMAKLLENDPFVGDPAYDPTKIKNLAENPLDVEQQACEDEEQVEEEVISVEEVMEEVSGIIPPGGLIVK